MEELRLNIVIEDFDRRRTEIYTTQLFTLLGIQRGSCGDAR